MDIEAVELREDFEDITGERLQQDGSSAGPSADSKQKPPTIRIGQKVAEERKVAEEGAKLLSMYKTIAPKAIAPSAASDPEEPDIVGWWIQERDIYYKLQVFDRPDTTRFARALDLEGDQWTAMIHEFWEVDEDREAQFNRYVQYCKPNAGSSTYCYHVWGSQVVDNRHVRFLVSGPGMPQPNKVWAGSLGEEWTEAIREYWRWRTAKLDQKKALGYLQFEGYGRDDILDDEGVPFPGSPPWSPDYRPSESAPPKVKERKPVWKGEIELDEISQMIEWADAHASKVRNGKSQMSQFEGKENLSMLCRSLQFPAMSVSQRVY